MENKKKSKKDLNTVENFNSIAAGILIGLGVIINVQTENHYIGALLFSFGLLTIIHLKLPLYTGRIGFLDGHLLLILFFNFIGIAYVCIAYIFCKPEFIQIIHNAAIQKFSKPYFQMFFGGIFCGMLIHFAVKCKISYITCMAVIIFILIGAEHCVADFPYLLSVFSIENCIKLAWVTVGNSLGAIFIEGLIQNEQ